jgi:hypothetical protein
MYWMVAVPAAVLLGVSQPTLCTALAGGPYHQQDATNR